MKCQDCQFWSMQTSALRQYGYGQCRADPKPGHSLSAVNVCRIGKFKPAEPRVIERRLKEMAVVL